MDVYKEKDGVYKKAHPTDAEKEVLWHFVRFFAVKWGIIIGINRVAKRMREMKKS